MIACPRCGCEIGTAAASLTKKQRELYDYIAEYIRRHGKGPSYDEMLHATGLKSKSGISRMVNCLRERGWIGHMPHRSRSVYILPRMQEHMR
jgi:repressor LexA